MRDFRHLIVFISISFICSCTTNKTNCINSETTEINVLNYPDITVNIEYDAQSYPLEIDTYNASCEVSIEPSVLYIGFPLVEYEREYYVIVEREIKPIIFHSISFCSSGAPFYCVTFNNKRYTGTMFTVLGAYNQVLTNKYLNANIYSSIEEAKHCILTGDAPTVEYATLSKIMEDYVKDSGAIYKKLTDRDFVLKPELIDKHTVYSIDKSGVIYPSVNRVKYIYYKDKSIYICYDNNVYTSINGARKALYNMIF